MMNYSTANLTHLVGEAFLNHDGITCHTVHERVLSSNGLVLKLEVSSNGCWDVLLRNSKTGMIAISLNSFRGENAQNDAHEDYRMADPYFSEVDARGGRFNHRGDEVVA